MNFLKKKKKNKKNKEENKKKKIVVIGDLKIIVVDDVKSNIDSLIEYFQIVGYNPESIKYYVSPLEAEKDIDNTIADLVLLDIRMDIKSGYEVAVELRKKGYTNLIFGLTGDATTLSTKKGLESGMDEVLEKPFDLDVFNSYLLKYGLDEYVKSDII